GSGALVAAILTAIRLEKAQAGIKPAFNPVEKLIRHGSLHLSLAEKNTGPQTAKQAPAKQSSRLSVCWCPKSRYWHRPVRWWRGCTISARKSNPRANRSKNINCPSAHNPVRESFPRG